MKVLQIKSLCHEITLAARLQSNIIWSEIWDIFLPMYTKGVATGYCDGRQA
jgi:hypothetical protein